MSNTYKHIHIICTFLFVSAFIAAPLNAGKTSPKKMSVPKTSAGLNLDKLVRHRGFNPLRTSVAIADVQTGRSIATYMPDLGLNPASCAKIVTAAAALSSLGPDHTFITDFRTNKTYSGGAIGTLYVAGTGDPLLINEELQKIAGNLRTKGIRRVTGGIAIDNSFFDSYYFPRKDGNETRAYTAKTAASAVNFNSVGIVIEPGPKAGLPAKIETNPPTDYFKIINKLVTGGKYRLGITMKPASQGDIITVTGRMPVRSESQEIYRSVSNPALYAGFIVKHWLEEAGIKVEGGVRETYTPAGAVSLYSHESKPLSEIVKEMNKRSNNFIAEQLTKHMGAVKFGRPGSTAKGIMVIEEYLSSIGILRGSYLLENGSGLSEISKISASQLTRVLIAADKNPKLGDKMRNSLSLMGIDGTTKQWHFAPDLTGKILVKTGTVNGVSTLAGFAPMANGRMAAFTILANNIPHGVAKAHEAEIGIVRAITEVSP